MELLLVFSLAVVFPWLVFTVVDKKNLGTASGIETTVMGNTETTAPCECSVQLLLGDGQVVSLPLETYLEGVLLREMPASFELEALKAQAVVARTYTLRRIGGTQKHAQAAVCTDPACCQGYCAEEEYLASGGSAEDIEKIRAAVVNTASEVLVFDGALIEATYFSCSGGRTEDALAVWGAEIPYLQAVDSPGEEAAAHYTDTVTFTANEFTQKLGYTPTGIATSWIGQISYTQGGGVDTIEIGNRKYTGSQLRSLLGLRSTAFVISAVGDTVTVTTKGYGHRVGMSQYGAEAMAVGGSDYTQILSHYYTGAEVVIYRF